MIIGAGIVGASCFYQLASADPKLSIVCFDKSHKLHGSTSRSAAAFRHQFSAAVNVQQSLLSWEAYKHFPERFGTEPVLKESGYCFAYWSEAGFEGATRRASRQHELGVPNLEVLDAGALHARFPDLEREGLVGGTFCGHDGFVLPDAITNGWFEAGERDGAALRQYAAVTGIEVTGGEVKGVHIEGHRFCRAPIVINTAGPWAGQVAALAGLDLPLTPVKRYLYFTHQLKTRDVSGFPLFVLDMETYCRPEANGLMLGWDLKPQKPQGWDRFPPPPTGPLQSDRIEAGFGIGPDDYGIEVLAATADRLPFLYEETGLMAVTAGYYEVSPDEKAIISWDPRAKGLLHATGFSGHGVMHAPATGQIVRALVLGEEPPVDVAALALGPLLENQARPDPETMVI
ncbi:MAG: NAD(P)/FAD-dependent oxidoreductase [Planctomycetota bacterium]